jgi:hypothetical protein
LTWADYNICINLEDISYLVGYGPKPINFVMLSVVCVDFVPLKKWSSGATS